jgi:hypothetical protein
MKYVRWGRIRGPELDVWHRLAGKLNYFGGFMTKCGCAVGKPVRYRKTKPLHMKICGNCARVKK